MRSRLIAAFKRYEIYLVAAIIGVVFTAAMGIVALLLRSSIIAPPLASLAGADLKRVFATAYLRFREDDSTPYLKVEVHNGTLWWIKKVDFDFDGVRYTLRDSEAFRPLHFGALRCVLKKTPNNTEQIEYDLRILSASGYPPARVQEDRSSRKVAGGTSRSSPQN
jgi:hypothetical protein